VIGFMQRGEASRRSSCFSHVEGVCLAALVVLLGATYMALAVVGVNASLHVSFSSLPKPFGVEGGWCPSILDF
jgi:hypothetical protein